MKAAAAKARADEISPVIEDLRRKIAGYGISAKELDLNDASASGAPHAGRAGTSTPKGPTYRGPQGEIWLGGKREPKPRWLTEELAKGKTLADHVFQRPG